MLCNDSTPNAVGNRNFTNGQKCACMMNRKDDVLTTILFVFARESGRGKFSRFFVLRYSFHIRLRTFFAIQIPLAPVCLELNAHIHNINKKSHSHTTFIIQMHAFLNNTTMQDIQSKEMPSVTFHIQYGCGIVSLLSNQFPSSRTSSIHFGRQCVYTAATRNHTNTHILVRLHSHSHKSLIPLLFVQRHNDTTQRPSTEKCFSCLPLRSDSIKMMMRCLYVIAIGIAAVVAVIVVIIIVRHHSSLVVRVFVYCYETEYDGPSSTATCYITFNNTDANTHKRKHTRHR